MSENPTARLPALPWEDQASHSPWPAFRTTMRLLIARPGEFYGRMAVRGGLHEPMTFFLALLAATVVMAFLAALAYTGLAAPSAGALSAREYFLLTLAPKATGLALGLLPEVLLIAAGLLVLGGSLFHLGTRIFGWRRREGSVSVLFYAASAALVPALAALLIIFLVSAAGWITQALRGAPMPGLRTVVMWTWRITFGLAAFAAVALFVAHCVIGCARVARLDAITATAAAACGLVFAGAVPVAAVIAFNAVGTATALLVLLLGGALAVALTLWQRAAARKARYERPGGDHD